MLIPIIQQSDSVTHTYMYMCMCVCVCVCLMFNYLSIMVYHRIFFFLIFNVVLISAVPEIGQASHGLDLAPRP